MASASVHSRISEFEAMRNKLHPATTSLLESPLSPTASKLKPIVPQPSPPRTHSAPVVDRQPSLLDLRDWVVDDGPSENGKPLGVMLTPTPPHSRLGSGTNIHRSPPLINLDSPPKLKANHAIRSSSPAPPPLPPRKPSYSSLKDAASTLTVDTPHTYPPSPKLNISNGNSNNINSSNSNGSLRIGLGHAPASSISSFHSVSLSSDGGTDLEPGTPASLSSNHIATFPMDKPDYQPPIHHDVTGSSTSSRPFTSANGSDIDATSLEESFENVSTTSLGSPATNSIISMDWERALAKSKFPYTPRSSAPPKLPQRPASAATKSAFTPPHITEPLPSKLRPTSSASSTYSFKSDGSSHTTTPGYTRRKPPPIPPSSYPSPPVSQPSSPPLPPARPGSSRISLTSNSASDRSSILSVSTNTSRSSFIAMQVDSQTTAKLPSRSQTQSPRINAAVLRPTPVPLAARTRYEAIFRANVDQVVRVERESRKRGKAHADASAVTKTKRTRQAAGWRGLSVDLITGITDLPPASPARGDDEDSDDEVLANRLRKARQSKQTLEDDEWEDLAKVAKPDRLDGSVIRLIWSKSRLDRECLKAIWLECDPTGAGSLTCDSFVRGMWRIDEELRRARIRSSSSSLRSWGSYKGTSTESPSSLATPKLPPKPQDILR